jgi:hypothetical protein
MPEGSGTRNLPEHSTYRLGTLKRPHYTYYQFCKKGVLACHVFAFFLCF